MAGRLGGSSRGRLASSTDPLDVKGELLSSARAVGLGEEAERIVAPPKLSTLQRLSKGLGAFNPAEAYLVGKEKNSALAGGLEYGKNVFTGIASAVTGTDYEPNRRSFKDVAEDAGIENEIAKAGLGFVGDVLLDPSTYFGGAIARGLTFGAKVATKVGMKGLSRVAPKAAEGVEMVGEGLKDAFGRAFQFGYGSQKGAKEDVLNFLSKRDRAKLGLAASNLNRLGTGVLTKDQSEELAMRLVAGKRAEFVAREAGEEGAGEKGLKVAAEGASPAVKTIIEQQTKRSKKFGEQLGLENPYEVYFPFLRADMVNKFVKETAQIKVGSEGYKKQFKNLLTNENLEKNPAKAFFTVEAQQVTDRMTRNFLSDFAGQFGKPLDAFKDVDEARKAGFELLREKGIFGKEIGFIPKADMALIRDSLTPEFQTVNMLAKATGFDALTSLFKRSVTGLFLPFHVRNFVSGMLQNFEVLGVGALNPAAIASGQKMAYLLARGEKPAAGVIKVGGKDVKFSKVFNAFRDRFGSDTFYHNDFLEAVDAGGALKQGAKLFSKETAKETLKTAGLGQESFLFKGARAIGQFVEHQQKATAYIVALGQGKSIDEALGLAEKAGFDYRAVTRFESQILRRIIPFYSFARKNIELQLRTLGENPQRINQIISALENAQGNLSAEEKEKLPDYAKEQFVVKTGEGEAGSPEIAVGFGTPIEAFATLFGVQKGTKDGGADTIRKTAAMLNPIFKVPLERAFNKDFFRDRPLDEVVEATEYQKAPQFIKDFLEVSEVPGANGKTKYNANPYRLQLLRNLPSARGATYLNAIFSDTSDTTKILSATTGIKPRPIDLETVEYFRQRDQQRALEDLLIRAGVLKRFEKTYEPK